MGPKDELVKTIKSVSEHYGHEWDSRLRHMLEKDLLFLARVLSKGYVHEKVLQKKLSKAELAEAMSNFSEPDTEIKRIEGV